MSTDRISDESRFHRPVRRKRSDLNLWFIENTSLLKRFFEPSGISRDNPSTNNWILSNFRKIPLENLNAL
jgi:hypothetical protein